MKSFFIKDLQLGQKLSCEAFVLKSLAKKTTKNNLPYWDVRFADKTGEISGKVWTDGIAASDENIIVNDIVAVEASVEENYNGAGLQLIVSGMNKTDDFDVADFIKTIDLDLDEFWARLLRFANSVENQYLKQLLQNILGDAEWAQRFKTWPAAERVHHDFIGGLLRHTVEMLSLADEAFKIYPEADRDLVIAGVILHDIGKIDELSVGSVISRSLEGSLLGHIYQGSALVEDFIDQIPEFPAALKAQVLHIILAHHLKLELGSPVEPRTMEAMFVHLLDYMSSQLQIWQKVMQNPGFLNDNWTEYQHLMSGKIYINREHQNGNAENTLAESAENNSAAMNTKNVQQVKPRADRNLPLPF
ncbi:MAG TPA: HD domain-containing protein [bacterium]|nr:HD domain-containing protein [bacterium]